MVLDSVVVRNASHSAARGKKRNVMMLNSGDEHNTCLAFIVTASMLVC